MEIQIAPKTVNLPFTFDKLFIRTMTVVPFQSATLYVQMHVIDTSGLLSDTQSTLSRTIELTTAEYNAWSTDEYIVDLILTKLSLTKQ